MRDTSPHEVAVYLSKIVNESLNTLQEHDHIVLDDHGRFKCTSVGHLSRTYYLKYLTSYQIKRGIVHKMSFHDVMMLFCNLHEFQEIPVRHRDDFYNSQIYEKVPMKIDDINFFLPSTKIFLILQGFWSRVSWPINDYETDLKLLMDQSPRVLQAILTMAIENGHLDSFFEIVHFVQCCAQGYYLQDSPLKHVESKQNQNLSQIPFINVIRDFRSKNKKFSYSKIEENLIAKFFVPDITVTVSDGSKVHTLDKSKKNMLEFPDDTTILIRMKLNRRFGPSKPITHKHWRDQPDSVMFMVGDEYKNTILSSKSSISRNGAMDNVYVTVESDKELNLKIGVLSLVYTGMDTLYDLNIKPMK